MIKDLPRRLSWFMWHGLLILCVVGFLVWVFDQNIPVAGTKILTYNFKDLSGAFSELYPRDRVAPDDEQTKDLKVKRITEDPVYFDVRTRMPYERATLRVEYQNTTSREVSLGIRIPGQEWKTALNRDGKRSKQGEWEVIESSFDLSKIPLHQNKYTFVISIPGMEYDKPEIGSLLASRAVVTLQRKSLLQ